MVHREIIIVGAGISGLLCANRLADASKDVKVIEASPHVGGRLSTKKFGDAVFDDGAQFFTARDLRFQMFVDDWIETGICKTWFVSEGSELGAQGYVRYCGSHQMRDISEHLAQNLEISTNSSIEKASYKGGKWILHSQGQPIHSCNTLILTAPLPQSLELLEKGSSPLDVSIHDELKSIKYQKRMVVLALMDQPIDLPTLGKLRPSNESVAWEADNYQKGVSKTKNAITIHSTAKYAQQNWFLKDEVIQEELISQLGTTANAIQSQCIRYPYAFPLTTWHDLFYKDQDRNLYLSGDSFGGPRVEGAALSGIQTADEYLEQSIMER